MASSEYTMSIYLLTLGFFFVFAAFNTVQMLESSVLTDKSLAFTTLSTIYAVFAATNIVAPKVVSLIGPRLGMFVGSVCYILLVVANIWPSWGTLVPASALVGIGAGVLWTSQGIYMSRCAAREARATGDKVDDVTGRFNGIFWAGFQLNGAAGLLLAGLLKGEGGISYQYIFTGFAIAGCVGVAILFLLKDAAPISKGGSAASLNDSESLLGAGSEDKGSDEETPGSAAAAAAASEVTLWDTLQLAYSSRRMQCIIPALLFNGMSLGFAQGAFTTMFASATDSTPPYYGLLSRAQYVGFYGASFYLANSVFSFAWGKVVPAVGRRRVFQLTGVVMALWLAGVTVVCLGGLAQGWPRDGYTQSTTARDTPLAYAAVFAAAIVFAMADSVLESQVPAILQSPAFFPVERERDAANSNLKLWQSLGFALQFILGVIFGGQGLARSVQLQTFILAPLLLAAYGGLMYCDSFVAAFDTAKVSSS